MNRERTVFQAKGATGAKALRQNVCGTCEEQQQRPLGQAQSEEGRSQRRGG